MRVLTVWHRLLIYFLNKKNEIIEDLTGITYTNEEDIEEIRTWSKADVKRVLDKFSSINDASSCPWCIISNCCCNNCSYSKRNRNCADPHSPYKQILLSMRNNGYVSQNNGKLYDNLAIKNLIEMIISVYKTLPEIL